MLSMASVWDVREMEKEEERSNQRKEQKDHKELRLCSEENRMARKGFKREKVCSLETEFWQQ